MFTNIAPENAVMVSVQFEGQPLELRQGLSVAAALLEAGITNFRDTPVSTSPRGPFCMMGVCFDCLVIIDDMPNQQSCMIEVCEGMRIERQSGNADVMKLNGPEEEAV